MKEALYVQNMNDSKVVRCLLCPNECRIPEGKTGRCHVRRNVEGRLYTVIGDRCCSAHFDPIEKKPLYHFYPGSRILSLGTYGCNFSCVFCQNWSLSQIDAKSAAPDEIRANVSKITPEDALELVQKTISLGNIGIAYTYNEPSIWYEFVLETAKLLNENGLVNVLVSNGYINVEPLRRLIPYIDAANVDIKSINPGFYRQYCKARLEPVLESCKILNEHVDLEITNLVIPTLNDSDEDFEGLVDWIYRNLGDDVPLHFSQYHPDYELGISATPLETLERARRLASRRLKYVYVGNVPDGRWSSTACPRCGTTVIRRSAMRFEECLLTGDGACPSCGERIRITGACGRGISEPRPQEN